MKFRHTRQFAIAVVLGGFAATATAQPLTWQTVVNNGDTMPGSTATFNSYSQPSVNAAGLIVFQGRASGSTVVHGIYGRDMLAATPPFNITGMGTAVPPPNNTFYNGVLASFEAFPSVPRIDTSSPAMAVRGQSLPVYTYLLGATETRVGTSGVYANPGGTLLTGASLLGAVLEGGTLTFPHYSVPGATAGTRFDQFPGAATITNGSVIAYKGNYTDPSDGIGRTGVFYRDVLASGGTSPTYEIASSNTVIPNQPPGGTTKFGSTAPPSAASGHMVFVGSDIEEAPTLGGIYRAALAQPPVLQTLVGIDDQVPGEAPGVGFRMFGEGLSISSDARYVSFWGTWGFETFPKTLFCPADGQAAVIAACLELYPAGYAVNIPSNQGIFVVDATSGDIYTVAKTGANGITDFLYWVFSGAPPGVGGEIMGLDPFVDATAEPPRWRSSAFAALSGSTGKVFQTAFKAHRNGVDGIYVRKDALTFSPLVTVAQILGSGTAIDPEAPADSIVTAVGIERDGFREGRLAITASMVYEDPLTSIGWAGIYLTSVPEVAVAPHVTVAVWRPSNARWFIDTTLDSTADFKVDFGAATDLPLVGRIDGDPVYDLVVFRNGIWYADLDRDGTAEYVTGFGGAAGDLPLLADFNNDAFDDFVVYRNGLWYVSTGHNAVADLLFGFGGAPGDIPLAGDVDGDGIADLVIYRNGVWYVDTNRDGATDQRAWFGGGVGDKPLLVDWNGDGKSDLVVVRDGVWYVNTQFDGTQQAWFYYGIGTDVPLAWRDR